MRKRFSKKFEQNKSEEYNHYFGKWKNPIEPDLIIKSNNALVTSDWHVPFKNQEWVEYFYQVGAEYDIDTVIVAGDFWDLDNFASFVRVSSSALNIVDEIGIVRQELERLTDKFKHIYFCAGNHEIRFARVLNSMKYINSPVAIKDLFRLTNIKRGYTVTNNNYIKLKSSDQDWLVCHPRQYSQVSLSVAKRLASKYLMNIANAHGHLLNIGWDVSHHFKLVDLGGLFDAQKLFYVRQVSTFPALQNGFVIIHDGCSVDIFDELGKVNQRRKVM